MTETQKTVVVSGGSGLLGTALISRLLDEGYSVVCLSRSTRPPASGGRVKQPGNLRFATWSVTKGELDPGVLENTDVLVHLAGESVGGGRWDAAFKEKIRQSRVQGTRLLRETIEKCASPPSVWVSASATGYYGDQGQREVTEESPQGDGFLAEVCEQWEHEAKTLARDDLRIVLARFGLVLAEHGGVLAKMLTPFKLGMGGALGQGDQYMSWVSLEDAVRGIHRAITDDRLSGPVNIVSPNPVTNAEFTRALGKALHRPTWFRVPKVALKLTMGTEMAHEMFLGGQRCKASRLEEAGFEWRHPTLEAALSDLLED